MRYLSVFLLVFCLFIQLHSQIISYSGVPVESLPLIITFDFPNQHVRPNERFSMTLSSVSKEDDLISLSDVIPLSDCVSVDGQVIFTVAENTFVKTEALNVPCLASSMFLSSIDAKSLTLVYDKERVELPLSANLLVLSNLVRTIPLEGGNYKTPTVPVDRYIPHQFDLPTAFSSMSDSPLIIEISSPSELLVKSDVYNNNYTTKIGLAAVRNGTTIVHLFNHSYTSFAMTILYKTTFTKNNLVLSIPQHNYIGHSSVLTVSDLSVYLIDVSPLKSVPLVAESFGVLTVQLKNILPHSPLFTVEDRSFSLHIDPSLSVDLEKIDPYCYTPEGAVVASAALDKSVLEGVSFSTILLSNLLPTAVIDNIFKCELRVKMGSPTKTPFFVEHFFFSKLTSTHLSDSSHEDIIHIWSVPTSVHSLEMVADAYLSSSDPHSLHLAFPSFLENTSLAVQGQGLTCKGAHSFAPGLSCVDVEGVENTINIQLTQAAFSHGFAGVTMAYPKDLKSLSLHYSRPQTPLSPSTLMAEVPVKVIDVSENNFKIQLSHSPLEVDEDVQPHYAFGDHLYLNFFPKLGHIEDKAMVCLSPVSSGLMVHIHTDTVTCVNDAKYHLSFVDGCFVVTRLNHLHATENELGLSFRLSVTSSLNQAIQTEVLKLNLAGADFAPVSVLNSDFRLPSFSPIAQHERVEFTRGFKHHEYIVTVSRKFKHIVVSPCDSIKFPDETIRMDIEGLRCTISDHSRIQCEEVAASTVDVVEIPFIVMGPVPQTTVVVESDGLTRIFPVKRVVFPLYIDDLQKNNHRLISFHLPVIGLKKDDVLELHTEGLKGEVFLSGDIRRNFVDNIKRVVGSISSEIVDHYRVHYLTFNQDIINDKGAVHTLVTFDMSYLTNIVRDESLTMTIIHRIKSSGKSENLGIFSFKALTEKSLFVTTLPVNLLPAPATHPSAPVTNTLTFITPVVFEGRARYSIVGVNLPEDADFAKVVSASCTHTDKLTLTIKDKQIYIDLDSIEAFSSCSLSFKTRVSLSDRLFIILTATDVTDRDQMEAIATLPIDLMYSPSVSLKSIKFDPKAKNEANNEVFDTLSLVVPYMDLSKQNKIDISFINYELTVGSAICRLSESSSDLFRVPASVVNHPGDTASSTLTLVFPKHSEARTANPVCEVELAVNGAGVNTDKPAPLQYVSLEVIDSYSVPLPSEGPTPFPVFDDISVKYLHDPIYHAPNGLSIIVTSLPLHPDTDIVLIFEKQIFADVTVSTDAFDVVVSDLFMRIKIKQLLPGLVSGRQLYIPLGLLSTPTVVQNLMISYEVFGKSHTFTSLLRQYITNFQLTSSTPDKAVVDALVHTHSVEGPYVSMAFNHNLPVGYSVFFQDYLFLKKALIRDVVSDCSVAQLQRLPVEEVSIQSHYTSIPPKTICHYVISVSSRVAPSDPRAVVSSAHGYQRFAYPLPLLSTGLPVMFGASLYTVSGSDSEKRGTYLSISTPHLTHTDSLTVSEGFTTTPTEKPMLLGPLGVLANSKVPMVHNSETEKYIYEGDKDKTPFSFEKAFVVFVDDFPSSSTQATIPVSVSVNDVVFEGDVALSSVHSPVNMENVTIVSNPLEQAGVLQVNLLVPRVTEVSVVIRFKNSIVSRFLNCYTTTGSLPFSEEDNSATLKFKTESNKSLSFSCTFEKTENKDHTTSAVHISVVDDVTKVELDRRGINGVVSGNYALNTVTHTFTLDSESTVDDIQKLYLSSLTTLLPEFNGDVSVTLSPPTGSLHAPLQLSAKITSSLASHVDRFTIARLQPLLIKNFTPVGEYSSGEVSESGVFHSCVDRCGVGCKMCDDVDGGVCAEDIDCREGLCKNNVCVAKDDKEDDDNNNDKKKPSGNTVWIVIGAIAAVLLIGGVVFYCLKKSKPAPHEGLLDSEEGLTGGFHSLNDH